MIMYLSYTQLMWTILYAMVIVNYQFMNMSDRTTIVLKPVDYEPTCYQVEIKVQERKKENTDYF